MAKAKVARKSTAIDMTPMVDLAFLLITFFMLTIKFRPPSNLEIATPSSVADAPLKDKDVLMIEIDKNGRIFVGTPSIKDRIETIKDINEVKKLGLEESEIKRIALHESFGVPYGKLKAFAGLSQAEQNNFLKNDKDATIPADSSDNQLQAWLLNYRLNNKNLMPTIKADQDVPYPVIRNIIDILKKQKANRFKLITNRKAMPKEQ